MVITNRNSSILTGVLVMAAGLCIAIVSQNPSNVIQYVVIACSYVGGAVTLLSVFEKRNNAPNKLDELSLEYEGYETSNKYQILIGTGLIVYATAITIFMEDVDTFLKATTFFLLLFGVAEIIFSYQVLDFTERPEWHTMVLKVIAGAVALIGAVLVMWTTLIDDNKALLISGIIISIIGFTFILLSRYIHK